MCTVLHPFARRGFRMQRGGALYPFTQNLRKRVLYQSGISGYTHSPKYGSLNCVSTFYHDCNHVYRKNLHFNSRWDFSIFETKF